MRLGARQEAPIPSMCVEKNEVPSARPALRGEADQPSPASPASTDDSEHETAQATSGHTPEQQSEVLPDTVATPWVVSPSDKCGQPKNLSLSEFEAQLNELIANHQDDWEPDTALDVRVLVGIFKGILEEHGVTHSGEITQEHLAALRQHFNHILPTYGRSPRLRPISPQELRAESKSRADDAVKNDQPAVRLGLRPATIRRHLGNLDHFLKHLRSSHYAVPTWTCEGLRPKKAHERRRPSPAGKAGSCGSASDIRPADFHRPSQQPTA